MTQIAPLIYQPLESKPWEGGCIPRPWHYRVTVAIPCWNLYEQIKTAVELWQCQSIKPYILLIDTGSSRENLDKIESLRCDNVEIHSIRQHGCIHPTDFVSTAMDLAMFLCRTPYLLCTHQDVYPRSQGVIEELVSYNQPAVGYHVTMPRYHDDAEGMIGHQLTLLDMRVMDRIGAFWTGRKLMRNFGIDHHAPVPERTWFPDTELALNYCLREHNIHPLIIGQEVREEFFKDDRIAHFRSITAARIYHKEVRAKIEGWMAIAQSEAEQHLNEWKENDTKPSLSIITPASRSESLHQIEMNAGENFDYEWLVIPDPKLTTCKECMRPDAKILTMKKQNNLAGYAAKNHGLKNAKNDWVFFLDDDALLDPDFFVVAAHSVRQYPDAEIFIFPVLGKSLRAEPSHVRVGRIDQGSYLVRRETIKDESYDAEYEHDGCMIEKLYKKHKNKTVFVQHTSITWNGLR